MRFAVGRCSHSKSTNVPSRGPRRPRLGHSEELLRRVKRSSTAVSFHRLPVLRRRNPRVQHFDCHRLRRHGGVLCCVRKCTELPRSGRTLTLTLLFAMFENTTAQNFLCRDFASGPQPPRLQRPFESRAATRCAPRAYNASFLCFRPSSHRAYLYPLFHLPPTPHRKNRLFRGEALVTSAFEGELVLVVFPLAKNALVC